MTIPYIVALFSQLKHFLLDFDFVALSNCFFLAIMVKSAVLPTARLAKFVALVKVTIC